MRKESSAIQRREKNMEISDICNYCIHQAWDLFVYVGCVCVYKNTHVSQTAEVIMIIMRST
jgi:hypothetical protein